MLLQLQGFEKGLNVSASMYTYTKNSIHVISYGESSTPGVEQTGSPNVTTLLSLSRSEAQGKSVHYPPSTMNPKSSSLQSLRQVAGDKIGGIAVHQPRLVFILSEPR